MTDVQQCGYEVQSRFVRTSNGKRVVEWRLAYYLMFCSLSVLPLGLRNLCIKNYFSVTD
jgi:hypothetical protein